MASQAARMQCVRDMLSVDEALAQPMKHGDKFLSKALKLVAHQTFYDVFARHVDSEEFVRHCLRTTNHLTFYWTIKDSLWRVQNLIALVKEIASLPLPTPKERTK